MDENKKKSYIIIGVCCVVALVLGLFTGKTMTDKRKLAKAEEYLAMEASNAVSSEASIKEVADASTEKSSVEAEEVVANEPQIKWVVSKEISFFAPFMGTQTDHEHEYSVNYLLYDNDSTGLCTENHSIYNFSYFYDGDEITFEDLAKAIDDCYAAGELNQYNSINTVYDNNGNKVKETSTYIDAFDEDTYTSTIVVDYEYDDNGNKIKCTEVDDNGEVYNTTSYEYDDNTNLVKEVNDNLGNIRTITYEYDDDGNLIKKTETSGSRVRTEIYEYDNNGNVVKCIYTYESDDSDTKSGVYEYENEYDENGNLVKATVTIDGDFWSCTLYTYEAIETP